MEDMHRARQREKAQSFSMLSLSLVLSLNLHVFTNQEALQPTPFGFLWRLHYMIKSLALAIDLTSSLSPSGRWRGGGRTESDNLLIM